MKNYCTKCGARISSKYSFCGNCGASLSDGLSPEVLSSVMVNELESGDVVYYRPPPPQTAQTTLPDSDQMFNLEDESIDGEVQTDAILPVVDIPLYKPQEATPVTEVPELSKSLGADMDNILSPMPLMDEFNFLETDLESEHFDAKDSPSDASEEATTSLEMLFSHDTREDSKSPPISKTEPDNELDENVRRFINDEPLSIPKSDSISLMGWVGIIFLLMIPAVNLLLIIIWALGGCRKKQKARFARALLIAIVVTALLVVVSQALLKDYINTAISNLLSGGGAVSELALKLLGGIIKTAGSWGLEIQSLFPHS